MKAEAQRIAIAEACGWKLAEERDRYGNQFYKRGDDWCRVGTVPTRCPPLPDYLNDLNAMHEAEKWIHEDANRGYEYDMALCKVVKAYEGIGLPCNHMRLYHATAEQRAEAFLRTIGKWVES